MKQKKESQNGDVRLSVVMSVYDDVRFLEACVDSILGQTFSDFEFLVVNDGSRQRQQIHSLAKRDSRIRVLENDENIGLTKSLNRAIREVRAPFVARMDCDDVAIPDRFERQYRILDRKPDIGLIGSRFRPIDENNVKGAAIWLPSDDIAIRWYALFLNPMCHPSTMFRTDVFRACGEYDERLRVSQDYELWVRMLEHTLAANIEEPLVWYRVNAQGSTSTHRLKQVETTEQIRHALWLKCGVDVDPCPIWEDVYQAARDADEWLTINDYSVGILLFRLYKGVRKNCLRLQVNLCREELTELGRRLFAVLVSDAGRHQAFELDQLPISDPRLDLLCLDSEGRMLMREIREVFSGRV